MSRPAIAHSHHSGTRWLFAVASVALVVLAVAISAGWSEGLDNTVLQEVRPGGAWASRQEQVNAWPARLSTSHTLAALVVVGVLGSALRRSWRPLAVAVLVSAGTVGLTALLKVAVPREDPALAVGRLGSFPSGHVAACTAVFVTAALATTGRVRWWAVLGSAVAAAWMSYVLVVVGMHWVTDCVGGVLVAIVVVTAVRAAVRELPKPRGRPTSPPATWTAPATRQERPRRRAPADRASARRVSTR